MINVAVNYPAVLVGGVIYIALGFLWYSPILFGKRFMMLMGWGPEKMKEKPKGMEKTYAMSFLSALVMSFALSVLSGYAGVGTALAGAKLGLLAGVGFVATSTLSSVLYEKKSFELYLINAGYYVVVLVVVGALLAIWV